MTKTSPMWDDAARVAEVHSYQILDTPFEAEFDSIAEQAAQTCQSPIALITFLTEDRQWFKATVGTSLTGTARAISFCTLAIEQEETTVVLDAEQDTRFVDNPLVTGETHIRFYAGVPLRAKNGMPLGTLCVLDQKPRAFSETQRFALEALAEQVVTQLEERKQRLEVRKQKREAAAAA